MLDSSDLDISVISSNMLKSKQMILSILSWKLQ